MEPESSQRSIGSAWAFSESASSPGHVDPVDPVGRVGALKSPCSPSTCFHNLFLPSSSGLSVACPSCCFLRLYMLLASTRWEATPAWGHVELVTAKAPPVPVLQRATGQATRQPGLTGISSVSLPLAPATCREGCCQHGHCLSGEGEMADG